MSQKPTYEELGQRIKQLEQAELNFKKTEEALRESDPMKKSEIKLRQLVLVLSIVAVLAVAIGGYLYYSTLRESALEREHRQASEHLKDTRDHIDSYLTWSLTSVKALAGLKELQQSLVSGDAVALARANTILDHFRDTMQASVSYLMDRSGNTIASSNRNTPASFVGKNYGFRPYFQQAMQGVPAIYMALGVTSKKRGIYFSQPVYGRGQEGPLGVAVIKTSIELIEEGFKKPHDGIVLLTDPHGVVFASDRKEWLYHVLWEVPSEEISEIAKTRQFGKGPWDWTGVKRVGKDSAVDNLGNEYHVHREELANYPGWHLVSLYDHHLVSKRVAGSLLGTVGFSVLALCVLIGLFVFFLYKKASSEIIQRERAEEALRESEERFRTAFENAATGIALMTNDGYFMKVNQALCRILGYSEEELLDKTWVEITEPDDLEGCYDWLKRVKAGEQSAFEKQFIHKLGHPVWVMVNSSLVRDSQGRARYYISLFQDIMSRKQAEEALRESEEKYRNLFNNAQVGLYRTKISDGKFVEVNDALARMFGYEDRAEILDAEYITADNYVDPDTREKLLAILREHGEFRNFEARLYREDRSAVWFRYSGRIYPEKGYIEGVAADITEEKRLEEQLLQSQKMEAIGTLAGGVAHDLNNILSGLVSYPELLLMDIPEDSPLRKPILTIQDSGQKAAVIVQDLLTLARRGVAITEVVNLNDIVYDHLESLEHEKLKSFHPGVEFEINLAPDLLNILGSPVHLYKTIMNLLSNAAEATLDAGTITMSTSNQYLDRPVRGYEDVQEGDYIVLSVVDSGIGMPEGDLARIFEPFYTKKVMGRSGTGLGMAVVWGTVKDHNGYIDVQSSKGKGTIFTLYFPVTRKERAKDKSLLPIEEYMGKGEFVLVVDDVEEQREIATGMLRKLGYSATSVSSGEEAVEYMQNNSADFIVLDMIMDPGINGRETYERIINLHPNQKAIIASGFSETDDVKVAIELGVGQYIKKPYTLEKIGIAVRDELKK